MDETAEKADDEGVEKLMAPMPEPDVVVERVVPVKCPRDTSRFMALRFVYGTASSGDAAPARQL